MGEDERGRKGREVLWNDVRYYAEGEYEGIRSKILRVQFKFTRFNCWEVRGPIFMLFLFYVNVSGMCPQFCLSSQPLTIPVPWVLFHIRWFITLDDCLSFPNGE